MGSICIYGDVIPTMGHSIILLIMQPANLRMHALSLSSYAAAREFPDLTWLTFDPAIQPRDTKVVGRPGNLGKAHR